MRLIFQLAVLTGQRRSEIAEALRLELSLEGNNPTWTIPGNDKKRGKVIRGRTKNGREQVTPLSAQAAELFKQAVELSDDAAFVFPANTASVKTGKEPRTPHISGQSASCAMRRLGERAMAKSLNSKGRNRQLAEVDRTPNARFDPRPNFEFH